MAGKSRQRGISLFTLIFILAVLGILGAVAMRAFPSVVEYQSALKAINRAKDETTVKAVRDAFDRAAQIDGISSISGKDLEVTKDGDKVVVSFAYEKEFHLFGPAWLTLKYEGTSRPGR
jgi:type II secretory pathway pseudopilin PulG